LVALRGGVGTLSEVALSWSLIQVAEMPRKPLVLMARTGGRSWRPFTAIHRQRARLALLSFADNVSQVLPLLNKSQEAGGKKQITHTEYAACVKENHHERKISPVGKGCHSCSARRCAKRRPRPR